MTARSSSSVSASARASASARPRPFGISGAPFHAALLVVGACFLLTNAFHGNVWFDESYSVAIAQHSFADIWSIGSNDVHPVLFYWCLHVLYLVFGTNLAVYRVFTVAGVVALAALGLSHVRRDFGWRAGVLFTFFVLFTPYFAIEGTQIRMYSWAAFSVMTCFLYAYRIFGAVRKRASDGTRRSELVWREARVPRHWWALFFLSSLASAYLHYFAAMAAFMINALLMLYLLARVRTCGRHLAAHVCGALVQVLLYAPWLVEVARQMAVVGNTYWATFSFPLTFIELGTYLFFTAPISFASRGSYGLPAEAASIVLVGAFIMMAIAVALYLIVRGVRAGRARGARGAVSSISAWACSDRVLACVAGIAVYAGVFAIGWTASVLMGSLIIYYRYLVVAAGPLLFAAALLVARIDSRILAGAVCAVVLGFAALNQALLVRDCYSPDNDAPLVYFDEAVRSASEAGSMDDADGMRDSASDAAVLDAGAAQPEPPLVLSSDIGVQGVLAVERPAVLQTYLDWQPGNWGAAYRAYEPSLISVASWSDALAGYSGRFVVVGQTEEGSEPKDLADLQEQWGAQVIRQQTFYRPYERTWFTIAVCQMP